MTPERYQQIGQLYLEALELIPEERPPFLERVCGADEELRREVESLLEANEQVGGIIDSHALEIAGELLGDAESRTLEAGHAVGHYRILSLLGAGGMGQVYLAQDTKLGRQVALKILPIEFTDDSERVQRFELEARAASALNHPNILTIYEIGQSDGTYFIATEFILGETLRARMEEGSMQLAEAIDIAAQVASALDVAHEAGVIHRDIKPENIMVRQDGLVKVLDFGLTKLLIKNTKTTKPSQATSAAALQWSTNQTEIGFVLGTVRYMSPEQTRDSSNVDHRTDIWSLGVVLYEMLTGCPPFEDEDVHKRITSIQESELPPIPKYMEAFPEGLEEIVQKALAKDPNDRYEAVKEMFTDLRKIKRMLDPGDEVNWSSSQMQTAPNRQSILTRTESVRGEKSSSNAGVAVNESFLRKRILIISLVAFGMLMAGVGFWAQRWLGRTFPPNGTPTPMMKVLPFTSFQNRELEPTFSPDGNQIAFVWNGSNGDNFDIYVKTLDDSEPLRLTNQITAERTPSWSPDGLSIAFIRSTENEDSIIIIPAGGGSERILYSIMRFGRSEALGQSISWSPDGKWLVISERESRITPFQIYLLSVDNLEKRRLTAPPAGTPGDRIPTIAPSGDTLAFARRVGNDTDDIYLMPLSGGEPTRLTSDKSLIGGIVWGPEGREIIYSSNRAGTQHLWKVSVSGGEPERVPAGEENPERLAISHQGRRLAYTSTLSDMNIWQIELQESKSLRTSSPVKLISSTRADTSPQYSLDGKKIVYTSSRTGSTEIWTCNADGSNHLRLTSFGGAHVGTPRWSPDGQQIVFDSTAEGNRDIYVVGLDGRGLRRLTLEPSMDVRPSWSRDGRFVYFGSDRSGEWQLWKLPADGGQATQVTKQGGREAFESFDGKHVFYAKNDVAGLWRVPAEGGEELKILDRAWQGAWVLWEQGVYFVNAEPGQVPSIDFYSLATLQTRRVTSLEKGPIWGGPMLAATVDGRRILYVHFDQTESDIMLIENF